MPATTAAGPPLAAARLVPLAALVGVLLVASCAQAFVPPPPPRGLATPVVVQVRGLLESARSRPLFSGCCGWALLSTEWRPHVCTYTHVINKPPHIGGRTG